ncbi:hypothetical protein O181_040863 [Austropuccinia psidii MF-1]|uniref:Uncharacterized protein n=1 Tax=Austropuccinia psidii MF-1 TaxID=1389203 RepID=A0A9Q3DI27_9BASI|nr:hypothetical protein [Austropuccinia psidii MF-1]
MEVVNFFRALGKCIASALSDSSSANFEKGRRHPMGQDPSILRHVRIFNSLAELDSDSSTGHPRVIIAMPMSMEYDFARILFACMAIQLSRLRRASQPTRISQKMAHLVHHLSGHLADAAARASRRPLNLYALLPLASADSVVDAIFFFTPSLLFVFIISVVNHSPNQLNNVTHDSVLPHLPSSLTY